MTRKLFTLLFCLALIGANFSSSTVQAASWISKVDPWLLQQGQALAPEADIEFLVVLKEKGDLSGANPSWTKQEKGAYVYQHLLEAARSTQGPVESELKSLGAETRAYWVVNMIWARGTWEAVRAAASRTDVEMVYGNPQIKQDLPDRSPTGSLNISPDAVEWNIVKVNADDVWAMGYTGQGAVIAGQDTGYDWDHPALVNQYREQQPGYGRHDYNWHDSIHSGGGSCGANSPVPCDDYGHGTHTMGTMVGDDGGTNQIGMAPDAKWIGCRNMNVGFGTPATYLECFEFFLAPYPVNGTPDDGLPELAPDVMSNSWGCPPSEGCSPATLQEAVIAARTAGIMVVASAGNSGSGCSSVADPIGTYNEVFTVGATDSGDQIAGFSSRGPSTFDGTIKPDISAPGVNVRSSVPGGGYEGGWSGTSMAAPHVAGQVALMISSEPALRGQIDLMEEIITQTATPRTSSQNCGGVPGDQIPNNTYGWGRIDALAAVNAIPHVPDASFTAPASAYVGHPVQFTDTTQGVGPFTYDWDFGDGTGTSIEQNPVYTYTVPGNFTVTQVVTNAYGSDTFTGTIQVLPVIDVQVVSLTLVSTGTIYTGFPTEFQAVVSPQDATLPVSYVMDFGDGTPIITTTVPAVSLDFAHTFTSPGTFTVTVWGLNNDMTRDDVIPSSIELTVVEYVVTYKVYLPLLLK